MRLARVIARTSGSSLSAVAMTGLMAMANETKGHAELAWSDLSSVLAAALEAIQTRSKARRGDKTVLDGLAAIVDATGDADSGEAFSQAALQATRSALVAMRDRPATKGRLRLAPDQGAGHDDPGMVALQRVVGAMSGA